MPGGKNSSTSRLEWQDAARQKIQGSAIINRLIDHTLADEDLMSTSQVNAGVKLLSKILPDLKAVEVTGEDGGPIKGKLQIVLNSKKSGD